MTKYLISFPGSAMDVSDEDMAAVGEAAHAVMREAKDAGVYVFGGGINEERRTADGRRRRHRHQPDLPADQGARRRLLRSGRSIARSRRPMGGEDRQRLPLLPGASRVRRRPRELTARLAARFARPAWKAASRLAASRATAPRVAAIDPGLHSFFPVTGLCHEDAPVWTRLCAVGYCRSPTQHGDGDRESPSRASRETTDAFETRGPQGDYPSRSERAGSGFGVIRRDGAIRGRDDRPSGIHLDPAEPGHQPPCALLGDDGVRSGVGQHGPLRRL